MKFILAALMNSFTEFSICFSLTIFDFSIYLFIVFSNKALTFQPALHYTID